MKQLFLGLIFLGASSSYGQYLLTEEKLLEIPKEKSPTLQQIWANETQAQLAKEEFLQKLSWKLVGEGKYEETKERPIIEFQPIFSPVRTYRVGVQKQFAKGVGVNAGVGVDEREFNFMNDKRTAATLVGQVDVTVDLWKDLLGRITEASKENVFLAQKQAEIQKDLSKAQFQIALRRLYWNLMAIDLSTDITETLLDLARKQQNVAQQRLRANIADQGELASYQSQTYQRESQVTLLNFQKNQLIRQLKEQVPELTDKNIELPSIDVDKKISEILKCSMVISSHEKAPIEYTTYDELMDLLEQTYKNELVIADRKGDWDVKMIGTYKQTGVDNSTNTAFQDIQDNNRTGYAVGVNLTIPLESHANKSEKFQKALQKHRFLAQRNQLQSRLDSTHNFLKNNIQYLFSVIKSQKANTLALNRRLKNMRTKFSQARVSESDLIIDQDRLMSSELTVIDTQLQILNNLLDYFEVFPQTPCEFNKL
jgi:hypothetical protein